MGCTPRSSRARASGITWTPSECCCCGACWGCSSRCGGSGSSELVGFEFLGHGNAGCTERVHHGREGLRAWKWCITSVGALTEEPPGEGRPLLEQFAEGGRHICG